MRNIKDYKMFEHRDNDIYFEEQREFEKIKVPIHRPRKVLGYKTPYEVFFSKFIKELNRISIA